MSSQGKTYLKFGAATVVILLLLGYLAYTGVQDSKSYYVTISELHKMGDGAYSKRLRVAGNVQPGAITVLSSAIAGVDTVTNALALTNGVDAESDAAVLLFVCV